MSQLNQVALQKLRQAAEQATTQKKKIIQFPTPVFTCAECKDRGVLDDGTACTCKAGQLQEQFAKEMLENRKKARLRKLEKNFGPMTVPATFQGLTPWTLMEKYGDAAKRNKVEAIKAVAAWAGVNLSTRRQIEPTAKRPGLFLYGEPGTGKSALAWWAVQQRGWGLWIAWNDFLGRVQNEWQGREALIEAAQTAPVLFLDDLGDPYTANGRLTDDRRTILFRIVNYRLANQLPTIITSNINGGNLDIVQVNLERQFDQRIVDRLWELCHFVEMGGANLRRATKKGA